MQSLYFASAFVSADRHEARVEGIFAGQSFTGHTAKRGHNVKYNTMENRVELEKTFWNSFAKKYDAYINNNVSKTYDTILVVYLIAKKE